MQSRPDTGLNLRKELREWTQTDEEKSTAEVRWLPSLETRRWENRYFGKIGVDFRAFRRLKSTEMCQNLIPNISLARQTVRKPLKTTF